MKKSFKGIFNINKMMDDLKSFSKPELIERAKEMGLKGFYKLKKAQLIELIENPPPKMDDDLDSLPRSALLERAKEIGLRGRYGLKNKELIELIRNPPSSDTKPKGVKRKVILQPVESEGEELVFPSIYAVAKHFNVNPGRFGWKVVAKKEETKKTIDIDGVKYKIRFEEV